MRLVTGQKKKARTTVITIRLSEAEHRDFKKVATSLGLDISSAIRFLVKQHTAR